MKKLTKIITLHIACTILIAGCQDSKRVHLDLAPGKQLSLSNKFENAFLIGAAINKGQIIGTDEPALKLLYQEFNSITPENTMKWMHIHPTEDSFSFDMPDKYVEMGATHNMHVVGHTLVWHSQLAPWMMGVKDSTEMAKHIEKHINNILERYEGKIHSWDVVNEALNEDGSYRESMFYKTLGSSYIDLAFKVAARASPDAQLLYNDYNLWKPEKRAGAVKLIKQLQEKGIKIDGIGMQGHWGLTEPSIAEIENSILAYSDLGLKVNITELDITVLPNPWNLEGAEVNQNFEGLARDERMNPYPHLLPDSVEWLLAKRYESIFKLFLKHKNKIDRITFWGINDGQSWLNDWPIKGRTNYPLLFDRNLHPKMAYDVVMGITEP